MHELHKATEMHLIKFKIGSGISDEEEISNQGKINTRN